MTNVYDLITDIKTFLRNNPVVNTVTFGDLSEVDLNKTTIYPLSHFMLGNTTVTNSTLRITISVLFLDIVDYTKDFNSDDFGDRQTDTNLVDVYNTQIQIANDLISHLKRGDLYRDSYQLVGDPVCEPFRDRFENELAGWATDLVIEVPNNFSIC